MLTALLTGLLFGLGPQDMPGQVRAPSGPSAPSGPNRSTGPSGPIGSVAPNGPVLTGGTTQPMPVRLEYPGAPSIDAFAAFADAQGQPRPTPCAAAGAADFDGDGSTDLWFLSSSPAGELAVQMARTSSLGRFRAWHAYPARTWVHGATFRSVDYNRGDRVLLVDPQSTTLIAAYYSYPFNGNPRAGFFAVNASWSIGAGAYEVATRDDDQDGHDDIAVLAALPGGWTEVKKLRMGTSLGFLAPELEVKGLLPAPARALRLFDCDGDGRSDAVVHMPGLGIAVLRDDGQRLVPIDFTPHALPLADLFAGDANRDGLDDWGAVLPQGIALALSRGNGFDWVALWNPAPAAGFAAGGVLGEGMGLLTAVVAVAADGQSHVLYPALGGAAFGPAETAVPVQPTAFIGPGLAGVPLVVADADGDGDQDAVVQLPDQAHWLRLRNGEADLRPTAVTILDQGPMGESGYTKFEVVAVMPRAGLALGFADVELAVFLEDITQSPPKHVYWTRLVAPVNPTTLQARFTLFSQGETSKLLGMIQQRNVTPFPGGISVGGDCVLSIHFKQAAAAAALGTERGASTILHHQAGGEPNKSAVGVKWEVRAEPPKPSADDELMPWS